MRSPVVVVVGIRGGNEVEMPKAKADQVVETFPLEAADSGLGVSIGDGRSDRRLDDVPVLACEMLVASLGELGVVVVDQVFQNDALVLS